MSISNTITYNFTNSLSHLTVEWSAEPNSNDPTLIFTFKIYFDAEGAERISKITSRTGTVEFYGKTYSFTAPEITGTEKVLIGTVVTDPIAPENLNKYTQVSGGGIIGDGDGDYTPSTYWVWLNDTKIQYSPGNFKAYTGWLSYVENKNNGKIERNLSQHVIGNPSTIAFENTRILGVESNITVTRNNDEFSHSISYSCGGESGVVCSQSSDTIVGVNLPISFAAQETKGTRVKVDFEITTYYGNAPLVTNSGYAYFTIPDTVKPSCTIEVTDGAYKNGQPIADIYGGFVQKQSMLHIVVTPVPAYGSPIVSYSVVANGGEFNTADTTTGVVKNSGTQQIAVTVTDERGRTSEIVTKTIDVIPYSVPVVTRVKITRCDENGVEQASGNDHIKVTFDAGISPVNDKNTASYMLTYQKTSGLQQTDIILTEYDGVYSVTDGSYIFEAATNSAYDVTISAIDDFGKGSRTTGGSTATTIFNIIASGLGMCFGGVATLENVIENMFLTYPSGGFMFPKIESGGSLYAINTPNVYSCESGYDVSGSPTENPYVLIVLPCGVDELVYIVIDTELNVYIRTLVDSSYSVWKTFTLTDAE